jgi:hypothetical protein
LVSAKIRRVCRLRNTFNYFATEGKWKVLSGKSKKALTSKLTTKFWCKKGKNIQLKQIGWTRVFYSGILYKLKMIH